MTKIVTEEWEPTSAYYYNLKAMRFNPNVTHKVAEVNKAFLFDGTPEGFDYWWRFYDGEMSPTEEQEAYAKWDAMKQQWDKENSKTDALKQAWEELESMEEQPLDIVAAWKETNPKCLSKPSAFSTQVGGNHYKDLPIQPVEFILANGLGFCEGNVVKYICRYKQKNGIQDLKKVIHYAQLLIEDLENDQPLIEKD